MGRRLPPGEAERRRKARVAFSFSPEAYQHYDPKTEGYGSAEEWIRQADHRAGARTRLHGTAPKTGLERDLGLLYLDALPADMARLKTAFRNTLFKVHPDHGGTDEACKDVLAAFDRLTKHYR